MLPSRDITRLLEIMAALRDPATGCPWDIEQTFETIIPYTVEETFEVVDAIERDDMEDLREELGDLLLQVVYYAQMARERGAFDFGDVVDGVTTKMIRRHPHVFGDEEARDAGMAEGTWARIKAEEKVERAKNRAARGLPPKTAHTGLLDDVPRTLPPLAQAVKLQARLATVGFDWGSAEAVLPKVREEVAELETEVRAGNRAGIEDELGDTLAVLANLARLAKVDPDRAVASTNAKMRRRVAAMEMANGGTLDGLDKDAMERLWDEAKRAERSSRID